MYILGVIVLCCSTFSILAVAIVARFEKRMIWPYGSPQPQPQFPDVSGYGRRQVAEALQARFSFLGWLPDVKGPRYKLDYAFLLSPERDTLALVGVGSVFGMPLCGTWLYSTALNDRVVYSTDNQSCVEADVSGRWKSQLVRTSSFAILLKRHRELLPKIGFIPRLFRPDRALEEFQSIRQEHFTAMLREGLISFTDASATYWRYSMRGASKVAFLNYTIGILRAITFGRFPSNA